MREARRRVRLSSRARADDERKGPRDEIKSSSFRSRRGINKRKKAMKSKKFFRTSGGTGLPAIAFDATRERINFGVFLARIFDVTSAFDCV